MGWGARSHGQDQEIELGGKREMAEEKENQAAVSEMPPAAVHSKPDDKLILYHWTQSFSSQKVNG